MFEKKKTTNKAKIKKECSNCKEMQDTMLNVTKDAHSMLKPIYEELKHMYDNNNLNLVISDCSFENLIQEVYDERHFTYQSYLQCPKCGTIFYLGICVRGTPIYKIMNCYPDIKEFIVQCKRDGKQIYQGKGI